jgi:predicted nucleic-acid-binding Zn-ribbon protein
MKQFQCKHCGNIQEISLWGQICRMHLFGKWVYAKCPKCGKRSWHKVPERSVRTNSGETAQFLDKLPKMYMVGCWVGYGVWDFPWSGKWEKNPYTGHMEPLVWYYNDHNGTADNWYLGPIRHTTTGVVVMWTEDRVVAESIAGALNLRKNIREQEKSNELK